MRTEIKTGTGTRMGTGWRMGTWSEMQDADKRRTEPLTGTAEAAAGDKAAVGHINTTHLNVTMVTARPSLHSQTVGCEGSIERHQCSLLLSTNQVS